MSEETRQHITEIEISATPDQVFRALTEAEQIVRWFAPEAKVEPGPDGNMVGGSYYISWGPGMDGRSTISIWEPGRRFAGFVERTKAYGCEGDPAVENEEVRRLVVDHQIEAIDGGKTRLRLVHSGFGHGAGWDNEFEGTKRGWPAFLRILKHGLERHPGVDSATVSVTLPSTIAPTEACRRLTLDGLKPGDRYSIKNLEGVVTTSDPPEHFGGVVENLNDGLLGLYCQPKFVNATFILWGPARDRAKQLETEWIEVLKEATSSA